MLPHLGQGANQSIEDGMALATILSRRARRIPAALLAYERLRRERVAEVQLGARQNGLRVVRLGLLPTWVRDAELAAHAEFRKRLYAYDVVPDARAAAAARCSRSRSAPARPASSRQTRLLLRAPLQGVEVDVSCATWTALSTSATSVPAPTRR